MEENPQVTQDQSQTNIESAPAADTTEFAAAEVTAPRRRGGLGTKLIALLIVGGLCGAVGYYVSPRKATAVPQNNLAQTNQTIINELTSARTLAEQQAKDLAEKLQIVQEQLKQARADADGQAESLAAAEDAVADLTFRLEQSGNSSAPLQTELDKAKSALTEAAGQLAQANQKLEGLDTKLADARRQMGTLQEEQRQFAATKEALSTGLRSQSQIAAQWRDLAGALDFGPAAQTTAANKPGEMPITVWELTAYAGQPTVSFQDGSKLDVQWGTAHRATLVDQVVTTIDGKPASRSLLPRTQAQITGQTPAPWRLGGSAEVRFADLAAMFGRPTKLTGTGDNFTATWQFGAWGRSATAKVTSGVVVEFDGRPTDGPTLCNLVRQRAVAYAPDQKAAGEWAEACRTTYRQAATAIGEQIKQEAVRQSQDGVTLKNYALAPFDSSGSWVGPGVGGATVRTLVSTTWSSPAKGTWTTTRYAVAAAAPRGQWQVALFESQD